MEVLLMKGLLKEEYGKLEEICGVVIHSEQKNINLIIQNALTLFLNQCEKPAIWCYGIHTKMLMADFIFCLKKVRYIIDNGIESKDDNGFKFITEHEILKNGIDGIVISSKIFKDEIIDNLKRNYPGIKYLDLYESLEKAGIRLNAEYYAGRHPYDKYCHLNDLQRNLIGENDKNALQKGLKAIISKYVEIKDFRSAIHYANKLIELSDGVWERNLLIQLNKIYALQIKAMERVDQNNVLMLCIDGLRRKDVCEEYMENLSRFIEKDMFFFNNAYSVSTSTFESLIPAYSENDDLRSRYYESDCIEKNKCRFILEAKKQKRKVFFYTDGFRYIDDDVISVTAYSQTATEKLWDFLLDAANEKNGLFYIHILYESHFSYPNPYTTEKIVADGMNILFDYLEKNGGKIRGDYDKQQKDSLRYLDDVIVPLISKLPCRFVLYADHGNILIEQEELSDIMKTKFTFHEELVQVPFAIRSPEVGVGISNNLISIMELNSVIIGLMNKNKFLFKEKDFIKIVRSEIYNPDFQYLYKKADIERGILAFEVFVFKEGYKLAVYSDGIAEVYLLETDAKINNEKLKMELYNRIKNSITVCISK